MYLVLTETEMYMCLCNLHFVSIGHYILLNFDKTPCKHVLK